MIIILLLWSGILSYVVINIDSLQKQPMCLYLEDVMDEVYRRSYDLTDNQWAIANAILNLLELVDQVTTTLSGKKYSTPAIDVWLLSLKTMIIQQ